MEQKKIQDAVRQILEAIGERSAKRRFAGDTSV